MKYQEKKEEKKSKYQAKQLPKSKFNFHYDERIVNYKTQIEEVPEKLKPKPNEKQYQKKVTLIENELEELKAERKKKKTQYKSRIRNDLEDIEELKYKISLGKKCLLVLNYDLNQYNDSLIQINEKIQENQKVLNELKKNPKKSQKLEYDEMTYEELQRQTQRLSIKVTTASLNKKQQTEINTLIGKLNRLKMNASKGPREIDHDERQNNQKRREGNENLRKLKKDKEFKDNQVSKIRQKIQTIEEDINEFSTTLKEIVLKDKDPEVQALLEETQESKKKIQSLKDELSKIKEDYSKETYEFQYEQEKIKWIKWATEIQDKKIKDWEEQMAAKRRQRNFREKKNNQNDKDKKQGEPQTKQIERKIINKHQKQIDACSFLIDYCKRLYPSTVNETQNKNQNNEVIEDSLKKGQWGKMKGIQIIQSKKTKGDEGKQKKVTKKKQKKEEAIEENPNKLHHEFFIGNIFDSINVVPPALVQELDKIVIELNEKLEYYISHPEGPTSKPEKVEKEKNKYTAEKYAKAKNQNKKIINTEDFPAL